MRSRWFALAVLAAGMATGVHAADDPAVVAEVTGRFRPSKPTAVMQYDVTYALLNIRLKRVAGATMKATEGSWYNSLASEWEPACLVDFHVASPRADQGSVRLFKRTVSVLRMSDLKLVTYAKVNDEFIKPFFGTGRRMNYSEIYNFDPGGLTYRRRDLVTGAVETNLTGMADLVRQSREVGDVLKILYANYRADTTAENIVTDKVHFNVDGAIRPFSLKMRKGRTSVPLLQGKLVALFADVVPGEDCISRNESFSMWCVPFREFSRQMRDPELGKLAETSLECSMLPLSGEYSLFLGSLHCTLTGVRIQPMTND